MPRLLTENQYRELCRYESGMPTWVDGGPLKSLVDRGYITNDYLRTNSFDVGMYVITILGAAALAAVRAHWGIAAPTNI